MESKRLAMLLVVLLRLGGRLCEGCLEEERTALFQLKPFFSFIDVGFYSIGEKDSSSNCCEWKRVKCNLITKRVTHLSLNVSNIIMFDDITLLEPSWDDVIYPNPINEMYHDSWRNKMKSWYLNASLFLPFKELHMLSLSGNLIAGCVHNEGFERLSLELNKLKILDLSYNNFNDSILSSLSELSSLKSLNLAGNLLTGTNPVNEKKGPKLSKLEVLDLSDNMLNNSIFSSLGMLSNLKYLYLDYNKLEGRIHMKGKGELGLIKLEVLALNDNHLNRDVLPSLAALPNLKSLYLDRNRLAGQIHIKDLNALKSLEELRLSSNGVTGFAPSQAELRLMNLKVVDLSDNLFNNTIFSSLAGLSNLKTLTLWSVRGPIDINGGLRNLEELHMSCYSGCTFNLRPPLLPSLKTLYLKGFSFNLTTIASPSHNKWQNLANLTLEDSSLPLNFLPTLSSLKYLHLSSCYVNDNFMHDFCKMTNLRELFISGNNLKGSLPMCFSNLTSLEILDLSFNDLSGNISALKSLASLQWLDLSYNKLQIPSSLGYLFNLSKLQYLSASNNIIYVDEMHSVAPRFQLREISLSCCGNGGSFPQFLNHQHDLVDVTLSHTHFKVNQFPFWLLENNTNLKRLYLVNCSLSGPFQVPFPSHLVLEDLDISNNFFSGNIPTEIGARLPSLSSLNMSKNDFNGSIPSSFGDMSSLQILDLSNNQLFGGIPEHLAWGCSSLEILALSNNTLQGPIFSSNFSLMSLSKLQLNGNNFSGMIPNALSNCSFLGTLDLSNNYLFGKIPSWIESMYSLSTFDVSRNQLSGRIPQWMGNTSNLGQIDVADNHLQGLIPRAFCNLNRQLQFLDLSMNNFSGILPSCFKPSNIEEVYLSKNMLQGPLPNAFRKSSFLVTLDLSYNHFSGHIPNWISNLSQLSYLLLKRNHFEGEIPIQLCKLPHLSLIDLSLNNLSGGIPSCLKVTALNKVPDNYSWISYNYLGANWSISIEESIEYTIKSRSDTYKKKILQYMSGIDLSCNKLTGEIPHEIKNILMLFTLNLSHNSLTGPIPRAFSNLRDIESLDLSYNNLTGNIPPEFALLHFLQYFNVSYNNLSGKTPERIGQLGTFDESSYVGNPFLCGSLVGKNCSPIAPPKAPSDSAKDHGFIDMDAFYASFFACYIVVLLCIGAVLYINPYWRQAWFYYVQMTINSCYYFVMDNLSRKFGC
ncbi:leucine-rich repeat receptor protein kinase MSP1-like [Gossypium australe]|uniref:Leucine-rich repeat receptor protein kinase MSP1-like n=1 Tax=Gossypium australe TaxID=47621 RepID=A0A5B6X951_9ROSI|nr:leucine-rich repeat receptor protein kinase MSP1-like [Gossypium australe]